MINFKRNQYDVTVFDGKYSSYPFGAILFQQGNETIEIHVVGTNVKFDVRLQEVGSINNEVFSGTITDLMNALRSVFQNASAETANADAIIAEIKGDVLPEYDTLQKLQNAFIRSVNTQIDLGTF